MLYHTLLRDINATAQGVVAHPSPYVGVGMGPTNVQREQKGPFLWLTGQ